jgi:MFS transporter, DHA2 family, multidrug resistance protein
VSQAQSTPAPLTGVPLLLAGLLLGLANFMVVLDITIANVAVPHIAGGLAVSPSQGTWVITSYSVAEAITVPLSGWLAQRFGAVKVFVFGLVGFGVCSILCGIAPTFGFLVFARILQGLCGGPIMPMSQTLLLQIFPKERAPQALGIWSMTTVVGPIAGPILGGAISDSIGWHWIFFINIPVAFGVAFLAYRALISRQEATRRVPVDYVGLGLLILWVGALQTMLDTGKEHDWFSSPLIIVLAIVAAVGFAVFMIWELTTENPIVNLKVFRHRGFSIGVLTLALTFGAFFGTVVLIPLWLQTNMGYTATWAGYAAAFQGVLAVVMSPIVASQVAKRDPRALVSFGIFWMAGIAIWRSHFATNADFMSIALPQLFLGFAMPFFFIPTQSIALGAVDPEETASAAGIANFLRVVAGAFATSLINTGWENTASSKRTELVGALNQPQGALDQMIAQGFTPDQALRQLEGLVQSQAVMLSTNEMFLITAGVFVVAASTIWLAPRPKRAPAPGSGH